MKSDKRHIEQLLHRFLNGESTIAEEETLSRYFASHEVDSEWMPYKQMFAYFDDAMSEKPVVKTKRQPLWLHPWIRRVATAAAAVALAIGVVWNILAPSQGNVVTLPMIDESQPVAESTIEKTSPSLVPDLATASIQKKHISASTRSACAATFTDDDIDIKQVLDNRLISDISVEDAINTYNEGLLAAREALENEMAEYNIDDILGAQTIAVP